MKTAQEYLKLADHYRQAADETSGNARFQLEALAHSYSILAESIRVLERSERVMQAPKRRKQGQR
jgi:hypothetical protein